MNKREQIKKWFEGGSLTNYWVVAVVCGLVFLSMLAGISSVQNIPFYLLFLVILLIPSFLLYKKHQQKGKLPSEMQLDNWLDEDIQAIIKDRPFDKLGISKDDLVAESMLVVGPIYWYVNGFDQNDILAKEGKDGFNRYSIWKVQLFLFTENYLCSYKCDYNWIKNTYINESTNEFFYKDVVSVKTDTVSSAHTLMNGQQMVHSEAFQLN
tara:strand:- start:176 stop:805 length:630 start_codon:yes stop_codon:yes gene_type:complete